MLGIHRFKKHLNCVDYNMGRLTQAKIEMLPKLLNIRIGAGKNGTRTDWGPKMIAYLQGGTYGHMIASGSCF